MESLARLIVLTMLILPFSALAALKTERVAYQDGGVELQGYLTWDDAVRGRRPGILVAHEWWGLNDYIRQRARTFAELGYVAFALDLYGQGKATEHPAEAKQWMEQISANLPLWQRRAQKALDILRNSPRVDPARLAAVGYCFGGATVMQLAYTGADLKAVISIHGTLPPATTEQAKRIKGAVFAAQGSEDNFVPPERLREFQAPLDAAGVDWFMLVLGNARHAFSNPAAGTHGIENLKYDEKADRRSFAVMKQFLNEQLGSPPPK